MTTNKALERVHGYLLQPLWPKQVEVGGVYQLQADDQDGDRTTGWIIVKVLSESQIEVQMSKYRQLFSVVIGKDEHPLVYTALIYLALAFQLDDQFYGTPWLLQAEIASIVDERLRGLCETLDLVPWLSTLKLGCYEVGPQELTKETVLETLQVVFTPFNDTYIGVGLASERIRQPSGGGHKICTLSALKILAEAIRLENEGGMTR